jgi:alpha-beta hydrolase superfamily lysophospholipase
MIWSVIGIVLLFYVGLTLLLFLFQAHLIYFPTRQLIATPATIGLTYETVRFQAADGVSLSGWFVPADGAKNVVLFFHGNAGNISHRLESIELFHRLGLSVFIIDYRGYGQSEGRPGEQGTYQDAAAAWRHLVEERGVKPEQIVLFGRSLGGGVATWLAQTHTPKALILESTFTSIPDMGARQFPFLPIRLFARIYYNTLERLPQVECPILIVHSPTDEVIPYSHGQQLFQAAPEPKTFLELTGGHNDGFIVSGPRYEAGLRAFIGE